ncbi:MAG: hypothetical protein CMI55_02110 [Parcubacteria group bacterium]|jgi:hypothetical protein|nr:hypothetical protein [Parcubacteria group bacterium]|tara:strand:+ start:10863 stop:11105 length:243 start_codon:yes stop_codon:yes gene_type:complete
MDKEFVDYLDKKFNGIDKKFSRIDRKSGRKFDKVLSGQDRILKRLDDLEQESTVSTELYSSHDKKIEEHEERIIALETKS